MSWLKNYFIKKFIVGFVIKQLEVIFSKLPLNDSKTVNGILVACLGIVLTSLPQCAPYIQPVLDYLHTLPSEQIAAGGIAFAIVGAFHKALKFILVRCGYEPAMPDLLSVKLAVDTEEQSKH